MSSLEYAVSGHATGVGVVDSSPIPTLTEEVIVLTRTKKIAIASTTAGLLVVGGTSFALGAAAGGNTVTACYATKTGDLRYLKSGACKAGEKKISWNVKGPKGATGARGPAGVAGTDGADGVDGTDGADGAVVSAEGTGTFGGGGTAINSAGAVAAETTISLPSAGYVVATGVGTLESTGDYSSAVCSFRLDGASVGYGSGITTVGPSNFGGPLVGTTRFFAPAGEHTVQWFCQRQSQGDSVLYNATFTLVATQ